MSTKKQVKEQVEKPLDEILDELNQEWVNDFTQANEFTLTEDSLRFSSLKQKWSTIRGRYAIRFRELEKKKEELLCRENVEKVKENRDLRNNTEAANFIKYNSEVYKKIESKLKDIVVILDILDNYLSDAVHKCFAIKNRIEIQKMDEM